MQSLKIIILLASTALPVAAIADGLAGAQVVITNTFSGDQTGGAEVDVAAFGLNNNLFATVGDTVEFPNFITLYSIDISDGALTFEWVETDFSKTLVGPTPAGNNDRNYFVFDLPDGTAITAVTFDPLASTLLEGSAEPKADITGPNRIVTNFSEGVVRGPGFAPVFKVTVEKGG